MMPADPARSNAVGDLITLEMQDRNLWNHAQIERGKTLLIGALGSGTHRAIPNSGRNQRRTFRGTRLREHRLERDLSAL